jgi:hypothetical protein
MNTSDLSGNESSEGSGKFVFIRKIILYLILSESPTQIGDDNSFDEPYMMRSPESKDFIFYLKIN